MNNKLCKTSYNFLVFCNSCILGGTLVKRFQTGYSMIFMGFHITWVLLFGKLLHSGPAFIVLFIWARVCQRDLDITGESCPWRIFIWVPLTETFLLKKKKKCLCVFKLSITPEPFVVMRPRFPSVSVSLYAGMISWKGESICQTVSHWEHGMIP